MLHPRRVFSVPIVNMDSHQVEQYVKRLISHAYVKFFSSLFRLYFSIVCKVEMYSQWFILVHALVNGYIAALNSYY